MILTKELVDYTAEVTDINFHIQQDYIPKVRELLEQFDAEHGRYRSHHKFDRNKNNLDVINTILYDYNRWWVYRATPNTSDCDIVDIRWEGDKVGNKLMQEDLLFRLIAPYVKSGCYISFTEYPTNTKWVWYFRNGEMVIR